jgi:leucine dehydrogenase
MNVIKDMRFAEFEQIAFCYDKNTGLEAIIAIHDTTLGPALGGTRIRPYATEEEALADVMKLAQAMTFKNAVAGLNYGGGKGIIIADPKKDKTETLMRAYGRFLESLGGRFVTGEDVGTDEFDMLAIRRETSYVIGLPELYGGGGNVSWATSFGLYRGIKAAVKHVFGTDSLQGIKFAIQGVGNVGSMLIPYLREEGAGDIYIADVDADRVAGVVREHGVKAVPPEEIHAQDVDVYAPCALGGSINDKTIAELKCRIIAGGANNQLADEEKHAKALKDKGIAFVVDYVINAGGVTSATSEILGYSRARSEFEVSRIYDRVLSLLSLAEAREVTTIEAAMIMARERLAEEKKLSGVRSGFRKALCPSPGNRW